MTLTEDDFWKGKVIEARHNQLDTVRKAAAGWTALFTAVLGIFGSVAFVGGFADLGDLGSTEAFLARLGVCVAAVLALVATIQCGLAANSMPTVTDDTTFQTMRDATKEKAEQALGRLRLGLRFGIAAAVVTLSGSALVTFAGGEDAAPAVPDVLAFVNDDALVCGPLSLEGGNLTVGGTTISSLSSLVVVEACP